VQRVAGTDRGSFEGAQRPDAKRGHQTERIGDATHVECGADSSVLIEGGVEVTSLVTNSEFRRTLLVAALITAPALAVRADENRPLACDLTRTALETALKAKAWVVDRDLNDTAFAIKTEREVNLGIPGERAVFMGIALRASTASPWCAFDCSQYGPRHEACERILGLY
jgi:hypothetical protein